MIGYVQLICSLSQSLGPLDANVVNESLFLEIRDSQVRPGPAADAAASVIGPRGGELCAEGGDVVVRHVRGHPRVALHTVSSVSI